MFNEDETEDEEEGPELEPDIDSNEMFCRFTPWQIDKYASHLLGEKPLCERWISRDGKEAVLYPLRLSWTTKAALAEQAHQTVNDMVGEWKRKFQKKTS